MVRQLFALVALLVAPSLPVGAYSSQAYVKLYNYTDTDLQVRVDDTLYGCVPASGSATWIPTAFGYHKVEVCKPDKNWHTASKFCEVSYSYPDATVEFGRYDL